MRCLRVVASLILYLNVSVDIEKVYLVFCTLCEEETAVALPANLSFPSGLNAGAPRKGLWWTREGTRKQSQKILPRLGNTEQG